MSDQKKKDPRGERRRVRLPDGTWGVYMGQTGGGRRPVRTDRPVGAPRAERPAPLHTGVPDVDRVSGKRRSGKAGFISRYSLSEEERREAERRKREIRQYRADVTRGKFEPARERLEEEGKKWKQRILDKIHMWHLGIAVNVDNIIKGAVCGALIVVFAMLQITVFSNLRPLGAIPDLMLPLVIAIGISEGERWGGVAGLAAAFLIDCLGSAGITLLPLLYVPCGFAAGVLGTYYVRDSFIIRAIFTASSGILRAAVTILYVHLSYSSVNVPLMFGRIVIPEYFSTLLFAAIPHVAAWLAFRPFHKSRADRIE